MHQGSSTSRLDLPADERADQFMAMRDRPSRPPAKALVFGCLAALARRVTPENSIGETNYFVRRSPSAAASTKSPLRSDENSLRYERWFERNKSA